MSEFECCNGHLMKSGKLYCDICGEPIATMDGMSGSELEAEDEQDDIDPDAEEAAYGKEED